ncbi:MAG: PAS domain S-box protein [Calditrichaeota bacterium]|nr:MAG: PAS domain S-box protein [Calditrichota bacterium]MBL1204375.1 PAS domain S-box protein [Calditrichota bacterium]NOG44204.1 PAS domain S-box protein [Calditrichota bacterium]
MNKILILRDNFWHNSAKKLIESDENIDILTFDAIDELPLSFGNEIYGGIFFLVNKTSNDLVEYIKKLRLYNNEQTIFVLGTAANKEVINKISDINNCLSFEKSSFFEEQLILLFNQLKDISQLHRQCEQNTHNIKKFIANSPECIITANHKGNLLNINQVFCDIFNYNPTQLINTNIDSYIPGYSFEEYLFFTRDPENNKKLITTFLDGAGQIKPVEINIIKSPQSENEFFLYLKSKSEDLNIRRMLDNQNKSFADLRELLNQFFHISNSNSNLKVLGNYIKQIVNCDTIINCPVVESNFKNKFIVDFENIAKQDQDAVSALKGVLETILKKPEISTFNFFNENDAHKEIIQFGRTATFIPIVNTHVVEIVILLYANPYEPDEFVMDIYKIVQDMARYRYLAEGKGELKKESFNFKEIVESALDGIYRSTIEGEVIYANPAFLDILGYKTIDQVKRNKVAFDFYPTENEREEFLNSLKHEKTVNNYVSNLKTRTGKLIKVLEHAHLITDDEGNSYIEGIIRDISENKQLENNLKNTRFFANELIEKANIIITVVAENGDYLVWNKKAEQVTGYKKEEILGASDIMDKLYPDEKYKNYVIHKRNEHIAENSSTPIEVKLVSKTGKEKIIRWTAVEIKAEHNNSVVVNFGIDTTEMRHLEKRFTETRRMDVFNSVTDKIAQQYNQIITSLTKSLDEIKEISAPETYAAFRDAELVMQEAHQFSDQILNLSGKQLSKAETAVDPDQIIENSIHILKNTIPESIKIDADLNSRGFVTVSEAQLNKVMLNLALNAVAAMPQGGDIFITSRVCKTDTDSFLIQNNAVNQNYLKVVFRDTGSGMNSSTIDRLFEPFFTTSKDASRKGLGASLIFNIIRSANGYIDVESEPNKGTTISFYLPFIHERRAVKSAKQSQLSKILIVDDQQVIREFLKDMANTDGYSTFLAEDGMEGLKIFEENHSEIDLAILDIIMPKMYGNELYYKIKEIKPELKVLITSAHTNKKIKQQLIKDGVDGFLPKPFDVQSAREQIRVLLS